MKHQEEEEEEEEDQDPRDPHCCCCLSSFSSSTLPPPKQQVLQLSKLGRGKRKLPLSLPTRRVLQSVSAAARRRREEEEEEREDFCRRVEEPKKGNGELHRTDILSLVQNRPNIHRTLNGEGIWAELQKSAKYGYTRSR